MKMNGPDYSQEENLIQSGHMYVAGVDEAGRGPLAGPVVAAAVILDPDNIPVGLNDSKQLSEAKRELLFNEILRSSITAWASVPAKVIDAINIRQATLLAMTRAVTSLSTSPTAILIDGRDVPETLKDRGSFVIKGDTLVLSIAAASVIAKVVRDRMMKCVAKTYPEYGFDKHKGYGSKLHRDKIHELGPCPLHRRTFSPIRDML